MVQVKLRTPVVLSAFQWDGGNVEGMKLMTMSLDAIEPLQPTLVVRAPSGGVEYARAGDWVVHGFSGPFVLTNDEFYEAYEVVRRNPGGE